MKRAPTMAQILCLAQAVYGVHTRLEVYRGWRRTQWIARVITQDSGEPTIWHVPTAISGGHTRADAKRALAAALRELEPKPKRGKK